MILRSKMLGLPAMAGRLREIAAFTTDGWLQRWKGYMDFVPAKSMQTIPGEKRVKVSGGGGCIGTS